MIENPPSELWTIGHSTRTLEEFLALLAGHRIGLLADVRRFPFSRRYPHFNGTPLAATLQPIGIAYHHFPALGGRRNPDPHSHNTAWRNASFRGYADYMETPEFLGAVSDLAARARTQRTAILCAEALWWRCHRSLIADLFKASGTSVYHIVSPAKADLHPYTAAARLENGKLTYAK